MKRKIYALILFSCAFACALSSNLQAAPTSNKATGKIVFTRGGAKGGIHVYSMNPDGSNQSVLIKNFGVNRDYSFRADGREVVFAGMGNQMNFDHTIRANDIFLMKISAKKPAIVYENLYAYSPVFSADGKGIIFSGGYHSQYNHIFGILKMKLDGSNLVCLTGKFSSKGSFIHNSYDQTPVITADGRKIIFTSQNSMQEGGEGVMALELTAVDFYKSINTVNSDGSNPTRLTDETSSNYDPAVSPDGKRLAFISERDGNPEIYVMNMDGSAQIRLTKSSANDAQPTWNPDSTMIAWASDKQIHVMSADGTGQKRLTNNDCGSTKPQWLKAVPLWKLHQAVPYVLTQALPSKPN